MDPVRGFFIAVKSGDDRGVSRYMSILTPRLIRYLELQMGAHRKDARDVVHQSMAYICEGILQGQITLGEGLFKYMQLTCRHAYIKLTRDRGRSKELSSIVGDAAVKYDHLDAMLHKEKQSILNGCIKKFSPENQAFIRFLIECPGCDPVDISERFGLSLSNVYTKKSRILKLLAECIQWEENR